MRHATENIYPLRHNNNDYLYFYELGSRRNANGYKQIKIYLIDLDNDAVEKFTFYGYTDRASVESVLKNNLPG